MAKQNFLRQYKDYFEQLKEEKSKTTNQCSWCEQTFEGEYYWQNIAKGFCSLDCTNEYLENEGFNPISSPNEISKIQVKYK